MMWQGEDKGLRLKELTSDLMTIRVETILNSRIPPGSMPDPRVALCDIAERYIIELRKLGIEIARFEQTTPPAGLLQAVDITREFWEEHKHLWEHDRAAGDRNTFRCVVDETQNKLEGISGTYDVLDDKQRAQIDLMERIRNNARTLINILNTCDHKFRSESLTSPSDDQHDNAAANDRITKGLIELGYSRKTLKPLNLTRRQITRIQKIWEVGTETIVMQTLVQVDGDVITRIHPAYAREYHAFLHEMHNDAVSTGVRFWCDLVKLAKELFETIWSMIFPGKSNTPSA